MSINLARDKQAPPPGYGMQQPGVPPVSASAPPMNYGTQPPYGAQQSSYGAQSAYSVPQQPYGAQQQPYGAQQQPYGAQQQPYGAQKPPYGTAPAFGQPPPQYAGYQQLPYQPGFPQQPYQAGGPIGMGNPAMSMPMSGMPVNAMGMNMGSVSLVKGGNMSLSKAVPNLQHVTIGLGWDVRSTPGAPFDLDASIFMLKGDGRVRMPQDLIFYNNLRSIDGSVMHMGDNLTGHTSQGEGDDEQIQVDLLRVPPEIQKIVCVVSIYEAEARGQNFGMVSRAFIRVCNADNKMEIVRFDLTEEASMFNCMVFGELYRYNNEWKFRAIGQGVPGGLRACGPMFGLAMQ